MHAQPYRRRASRAATIAFAAALSSLPLTASAIDYAWDATTTKAFNESSAWLPNGVPSTNDTATFNKGINHTVNFTAAATNKVLYVRNDNVTFNFSPGITYTATDSSRALSMGRVAGENARLTLQGGGTLSANGAAIGDVAGSNGSVTVNAGTTFNIPSTIAFIGLDGNADVQLTGGGQLNGGSGGLYVAYRNTSAAKVTVEGAGSKLTTQFGFFVGASGTAAVNVSGGGAVDTGSTFLGYFGGSKSTVALQGAGTTWTDHGQFAVGSGGDANLSVEQGAHLTTPFFVVGFDNANDTFSPSATLRNPGSRIDVAGDAIVGRFSYGATMTISDGAQMTSVTGKVGLGTAVQSTLKIQDPGSAWTMTGALTVGSISSGRIDVLREASLTSGAATLASTEGTGATVNIDGSTWTVNGGMTVGFQGDAAVTVVHGGVVSATNVITLGQNGGPTPFQTGHGSVGVDGVGSKFKTTDGIYVGVGGTGQMGAQAGGKIESSFGVVGFAGKGQAGVTGANSAWTLQGNLLIGNGDVGVDQSATISSATLTVGDSAQPAAQATLQLNAGATYTASTSATVRANGTVSLGNSPALAGTLVSPSVTNNGMLIGNGTVQGNLVNNKDIRPGDTFPVPFEMGTITVQGNYQQSATGALHIGIDGTALGSFDRLTSTGTMNLAGALNVSFPFGYSAGNGSSFNILSAGGGISGLFSTLNLAPLGAGLVWDTNQLYTLGNLRVVLGAGWKADANGNWGVATNWNGPVPSGATNTAVFGPVISLPRTVTLDTSRTVGAVQFNSPFSYTIAPSANSTLTLDVPSGRASVQVQAGDQRIDARVILNDDTDFSVSPGAILRIDRLDDNGAGRSLYKAGDGTLAVSRFKLAGLNVSAGKFVSSVPGSGPVANSVTSLSISAGATVDLTRDALLIDYASAGPSPLGTIVGYLTAAYDHGKWDLPGLTSSAAANHPAKATALGYIDTAQFNPGAILGVAPDPTSVVVAYTWVGDANLDGTVNRSDFNRVLNGLGLPGKWWDGDFNYDGKVTADDLALFSLGVAAQTGSYPAVPEPVSGVVTFAGTGLALAMRRRR